GGMARHSRSERECRQPELDDVIDDDTELRKPKRLMLEHPRQRIRNGLRLVMPNEAREVRPTRIVPNLDEAGAQHDAHDEPAKRPNDYRGGRRIGKRSDAPRRAKERREDAGLEDLDLPTERREILAEVRDRRIKDPHREEHEAVRHAGEDRER